ncbi:MAG: D-glycero-beta-D-manno-heptose-7-phosphate kinase [Deltaproteobacteria bacterium]|nr:D-glycero-beta-D-manno-heptose-7-phosphate kinase [Deltaproteobacteria bacterium]
MSTRKGNKRARGSARTRNDEPDPTPPSSARRLATLLAAFRRARVLVVGDLMLDRFIWGDVRRISPEAPVPVVQVTRESMHPGGAGNVVANLASLGARPHVVGWVGRDAAGSAIRVLLDELGADAGGVLVSDAAATIEKTRIIAHHQQVVRLDREPYRPGGRIEQELVRRVARELPRAQVVIVSDYGKGTIHPALLDLLAERRDRDGFLYLIDPKQPNFAHYRGATLVKPNEGETAAAAGIPIDGPDALEQAAATLLERWQSDAVLISRGEHGMSLCRRGAPPRNFPAAAREVFDVTGAGDTVLAIAALALAGGGTLEEAAWLANVGAGVVVGKVGTATLRNEELGEAVVAAIADAREGRARA